MIVVSYVHEVCRCSITTSSRQYYISTQLWCHGCTELLPLSNHCDGRASVTRCVEQHLTLWLRLGIALLFIALLVICYGTLISDSLANTISFNLFFSSRITCCPTLDVVRLRKVCVSVVINQLLFPTILFCRSWAMGAEQGNFLHTGGGHHPFTNKVPRVSGGSNEKQPASFTSHCDPCWERLPKWKQEDATCRRTNASLSHESCLHQETSSKHQESSIEQGLQFL